MNKRATRGHGREEREERGEEERDTRALNVIIHRLCSLLVSLVMNENVLHFLDDSDQ